MDLIELGNASTLVPDCFRPELSAHVLLSHENEWLKCDMDFLVCL